MTIETVITQTDSLRPNQYSSEQKIKWLSDLDGQVFNELIAVHEPKAGETAMESFSGYDSTVSLSTELLVPYPYSDVYIWYLIRCIDLYNSETAKYNNSNAMYNNMYLTYSDYYTRTHMPKTAVNTFRV